MECTSDPCVCSLDGECRDYCFPPREEPDAAGR